MKFVVTIPGPPQPKERARMGTRRGRRVWYTPERTVAYEDAVRENVQIAVPPSWPTNAVYAVELAAYFPDKRARDIDNVCKSCLDACNKVLWRDDSQVHRVVLERHIDRTNPRTVLTFAVVEAA
jgi:Holliday junction resolvase RusA-like endonuclease